MNLNIVPPDGEDEFKFIIDSWTNSFRKSPYAGCVPNNLWPKVDRQKILQLVSREGCKVMVALSPTSDGTRGRIMGYYVAEPEVMHWIYVKRAYRRLGVGSALIRHSNDSGLTNLKRTRYTHKTEVSSRFLPPSWKWDPIPSRVRA